MDYRCPLCGLDQGKRKLIHSIIARMEMDCSHCKRTIRLNVHRAEMVIVLVNFATIVLLGALAYRFQSHELVLFTVGAVMLGALALPLLEQTWLRNWPRYATVQSDHQQGSA